MYTINCLFLLEEQRKYELYFCFGNKCFSHRKLKTFLKVRKDFPEMICFQRLLMHKNICRQKNNIR